VRDKNRRDDATKSILIRFLEKIKKESDRSIIIMMICGRW